MDQTVLPLERGFAQRAEPMFSRYRRAKDGLVESFGNCYIVYGCWEKLFGCWFVEKTNFSSKSQELLPCWPVLVEPNNYGSASTVSVLRHLEDVDIRGVVGRRVATGARADYWFATYLQDIPTLVQRLASPFGWKQWLVLDLANQVPGFWRFLHDEKVNGRTGYVGTCLALLYSFEDRTRARRHEIGWKIAFERRREVLELLSGRRVSRSDVQVLGGLPADVTPIDVSHTLDALSRHDAANILKHADTITPALVQAVESLPDGFVHPNLSQIVSDNVSVDYLHHTIDTVTRLLTEEQLRQAGQAFARVNSDCDLDRWAEKWIERGLENFHFPPAPLQVDEPLTPITSYSALKAESRNMRNCVADYWSEAIAGEIYFYHWGGNEEATVSFMSTPSGEWRFDEALGYGNEQLEEETLN